MEQPARILVVDDDGDMRALLADELRREGYEVTEAGDGGEAVLACRRAEFDVILMDKNMPGPSGLVLLPITGAHAYIRLVRERERFVGLAVTDQRIFGETLALAVRQNVRRGRTTEQLQELLDDIRARPGLIWVAIFDPKGQVVAASIASGDATPTNDTVIDLALRAGEPISSFIGDGNHRVLRYVRPFRWPGGGMGALELRHGLGQAQEEAARALREGVMLRLAVLALLALSILAVTRWSIPP